HKIPEIITFFNPYKSPNLPEIKINAPEVKGKDAMNQDLSISVTSGKESDNEFIIGRMFVVEAWFIVCANVTVRIVRNSEVKVRYVGGLESMLENIVVYVE
ncbi:hypothetical protein WICPIJ_001270, partial [Wickerhamomyces pijperi]